MIIKTLFILTWVAITYYYSLFGTDSIVLYTISAILLGVGHGNIGINIQHDGNHGSYTNKSWLTRTMGTTMDFIMGGSSFVWIYQHCVGHHVHTNVVGYDPDIRTAPGTEDIRRIHEGQLWHQKYSNQHKIIGYLYFVLAWKWYFQDFVVFWEKKIDKIAVGYESLLETTIFYLGKLIFPLYTIIIPIYFGVSIPRVIGTLLLWLAAEGYWLAYFFEVNHLTEKAVIVTPETLKDDWAVQQIVGSTNFAPDSVFWNSLSGGLSHQIEHHLFPTVSHIYYPEIAPIVRQACKEFNVPYMAYSSFWSAINGHFKHLKNMGKEPSR